jgi:hypothetical protein
MVINHIVVEVITKIHSSMLHELLGKEVDTDRFYTIVHNLVKDLPDEDHKDNICFAATELLNQMQGLKNSLEGK